MGVFGSSHSGRSKKQRQVRVPIRKKVTRNQLGPVVLNQGPSVRATKKKRGAEGSIKECEKRAERAD